MAKVYIAKSNRAKFDDVAIVREFLTAQGHTIVEYTGGAPYSDGPMLSSDFVIVIPDNHSAEPIVGKGIYSQVSVVMFNSKLPLYCFNPISVKDRSDIFLNKIMDSEVTDSTNWQAHGKITLHPNTVKFTSLIMTAKKTVVNTDRAAKADNSSNDSIKSIL